MESSKLIASNAVLRLRGGGGCFSAEPASPNASVFQCHPVLVCTSQTQGNRSSTVYVTFSPISANAAPALGPPIGQSTPDNSWRAINAAPSSTPNNTCSAGGRNLTAVPPSPPTYQSGASSPERRGFHSSLNPFEGTPEQTPLQRRHTLPGTLRSVPGDPSFTMHSAPGGQTASRRSPCSPAQLDQSSSLHLAAPRMNMTSSDEYPETSHSSYMAAPQAGGLRRHGGFPSSMNPFEGAPAQMPTRRQTMSPARNAPRNDSFKTRSAPGRMSASGLPCLRDSFSPGIPSGPPMFESTRNNYSGSQIPSDFQSLAEGSSASGMDSCCCDDNSQFLDTIQDYQAKRRNQVLAECQKQNRSM